MIQLQCTLFSDKGYKPMSTVLSVDSIKYYNQNSKEVKAKAVQKICAQRYMTKYHLKEYGYSKMKVRKYERNEELKMPNEMRETGCDVSV